MIKIFKLLCSYCSTLKTYSLPPSKKPQHIVIIKKKNHFLGWLAFLTLVCIVGFGLIFFATELNNITELILMQIPSDIIPERLFMDQDSGAGGDEDNPGLSSGSSEISDVDEIEHLHEQLAQRAAERAQRAAERARELEEQFRLRDEQLRLQEERIAESNAKLEELTQKVADKGGSEEENAEQSRQLEQQLRETQEQAAEHIRQLMEEMRDTLDELAQYNRSDEDED